MDFDVVSIFIPIWDAKTFEIDQTGLLYYDMLIHLREPMNTWRPKFTGHVKVRHQSTICVVFWVLIIGASSKLLTAA